MRKKNKFYVYVYLNPLKPGKFEYNEYVFEYEPFYIGKGFGDRMFYHLKLKGRNYLKNKIISDLLKNNLTPIIIKLYDNLTDVDSLVAEIAVIKTIGRIELNSGPLTNLTDGGDGSSGHIQSDATKNKRVESLKNSTFYETVRSDKFRESASKFFKEYYSHPDSIKKLSDLRIEDKNPMYGKQHSEETKQKMSKSHSGDKNHFFGKFHTDETKSKISKSRIGTKNKNIRSDAMNYLLIDSDGVEYEISGSRNLLIFCKDNKIQYNALKNNINKIITETETVGNKIFAKNTLGWKIQIKN